MLKTIKHESKGDVVKVAQYLTGYAQIKEASGEFDGADGYTPVKYKDYYTEADKAEMVSLVLTALPTWSGGNY